MARKIVITSGKGGVGKTTVCFLLGKMLANRGNRVVLFDVDIGLNNLDVVSGVEKKVVFDIVDVALNKCRVNQALVDVCGCDNMFILPSAHSENMGKVDLNGIQHVVDSLDKNFDYILIDCPAGIDYAFLRAVFCANEAIIVSNPQISALLDASKVSQVLATLNLVGVSLLLNRVDYNLVKSKKQLNPLDIAQTLNLPLIGVLEENSDILVASSLVGDLSSVPLGKMSGLNDILCNIINGTFINEKKTNFMFN